MLPTIAKNNLQKIPKFYLDLTFLFSLFQCGAGKVNIYTYSMDCRESNVEQGKGVGGGGAGGKGRR